MKLSPSQEKILAYGGAVVISVGILIWQWNAPPKKQKGKATPKPAAVVKKQDSGMREDDGGGGKTLSQGKPPQWAGGVNRRAGQGLQKSGEPEDSNTPDEQPAPTPTPQKKTGGGGDVAPPSTDSYGNSGVGGGSGGGGIGGGSIGGGVGGGGGLGVSNVTSEYWLNTDSGARHNPRCTLFGTPPGKPCGANEGKPCRLCGG